MIIRSPEPEVKILVDRDPIKTSFEEWARPGHFSRTIAKGPDTTTWIWNLHADAHDFDSHTSDLEEISRKVFSAHFGQLSIIFLWLSGMYFHGARFSNYEAWLSDPTHIGPSAQVVWPIVGQEILNGDVAGHMYRTNWGIGHGIKDILEAYKGPFIAHNMYAMPPYPYLATDYGTQLLLFTHHIWISGFLIVGAVVHATIFMVRDYDPTTRCNDLLDHVLRHRDAIISHLNWSSITINGWLRDFLWAQATQGIQSYGSSL
ncbi:hypothetical protein POTOM_005202 [Populus tomentosa]|uniref:Photosystem I chlorophyll a apoprotein A1 n=1 Tax=Populus tomentosa TaxID=118781 RepID=A0A8X8AWD2_POPTO|nr:hypothetical protein POTOM_005202 [Populus tomentosa]